MPNNGISGLEAHTEANQNINNLKYVNDKEMIEYKSNILNKIHNNGIRKYNIVGEK
ncbi:heme transporter CcmA [Basfia succiniciproducens]|uniref:heme transporter CcmA n=1 Tax=Basfia succiniciproducens TaxID=653940 RepID=UPI000B30E19D|nr:heme transporter CcmA [Basfia succiniciproducens]